jgi:hypothetical protein
MDWAGRALPPPRPRCTPGLEDDARGEVAGLAVAACGLEIFKSQRRAADGDGWAVRGPPMDTS